MPIILPESAHDSWLDPREQRPERLLRLLAPAGEELTALAVSDAVNSPRHDGPECIEPAGEEPSLFA
jgi:putative SOS response-associated peptidase YedK